MSNLWVTPEELDTPSSDYAYEACKTASYLLWAMSGRKYSGITTVTERYVSSYDPYLRSGGSSLTYTPVLVDGNVVNIASGGFNRYADDDFQGDGTSANSRVRLRGRKVVKIHTLRDLDGNIIDPSKYYLSVHSTILGLPGPGWSLFCIPLFRVRRFPYTTEGGKLNTANRLKKPTGRTSLAIHEPPHGHRSHALQLHKEGATSCRRGVASTVGAHTAKLRRMLWVAATETHKVGLGSAWRFLSST